MSPLVMRLFTLVGIALMAVGMQMKARADSLTAPDVQQVQAVILAQLKAFSEDDAEAAFATATPEVRKAIGEATRFLALVRGNYPMVYRPAGFGFLAPELDKDVVLQVVTIRDADDKTWLALFALERQPDQSWRIGGCIVAENDWRST
jgi:Domain of unknown function (DUF4864)